MVGDPKHLSDLRRIEADVRVTCAECGLEEDWDVDALAARLHRTGGSTVWTEITRKLRCRRFGCGGRDLRAVPVPFARRPPNTPRKVGALDAALIDLSMKVLYEAAYRWTAGPVGTMEVRLALYVVYRYVRERHLVDEYWRIANRARGWAGEPACLDAFQAIRTRLERTGWLLPPPDLVRDQTWPWDSPPPDDWTGDVRERAEPGLRPPG